MGTTTTTNTTTTTTTTTTTPFVRSFGRWFGGWRALTCTIPSFRPACTRACLAWGADIQRFVAPVSSSATPHSDELRYLCAFAGSGFTDQHERLIVLETVQNLVTVLAYRQPFALRCKIKRLVGVEDERRYVIIRWCRVPFRCKRFVIRFEELWKSARTHNPPRAASCVCVFAFHLYTDGGR